MNLPNILTLSRLVLSGVLMALLTFSVPGFKLLALAVFLVAAATDYLDGYLARHGHGITAFGQLMDPLTDKILVCVAFVGFVELQLVPAWIVVIIIAREFLVTGLRLVAASSGRILEAETWGKHKTLWQIVVIVALLAGLALRDDLPARYHTALLANYDVVLRYAAWYLALVVAAITVISGGIYFLANRALLAEHMLNNTRGKPGAA